MYIASVIMVASIAQPQTRFFTQILSVPPHHSRSMAFTSLLSRVARALVVVGLVVEGGLLRSLESCESQQESTRTCPRPIEQI